VEKLLCGLALRQSITASRRLSWSTFGYKPPVVDQVHLTTEDVPDQLSSAALPPFGQTAAPDTERQR
jgi:hypothetical protein